MPKPWATCMDCMSLAPDERPQPPPEIAPPTAVPKKKKAAKKVAKKATTPAGGSGGKRTPSAPQVGRLPRSALDEVPDLVGDKDLAYEIPPSEVDYYISGSESGWLPITQMPKQLRSHGFVYLQIDGGLVAKAQVRGIGFREQRWDHAPPDLATDLGPGPTIELASEWSGASIDLGPDGTATITGYRYLVEMPDGTVVVAPQPQST